MDENNLDVHQSGCYTQSDSPLRNASWHFDIGSIVCESRRALALFYAKAVKARHSHA
jgi:hypothetical protein